MFTHLLRKGFPSKYTFWNMHGEKEVQHNVQSADHIDAPPTRQRPMQDMLNDVFGVVFDQGV